MTTPTDKGPAQPGAVWPSHPRETVQVTWEDGRVYEGPAGTPLYAFVDAAFPSHAHPIMAAVVGHDLEELSYRVDADIRARPVDTTTPDGMRVYQRSLTFVLITAAQELYPEAQLIIDHSVTLGGFFCQIIGRPVFNGEELDLLAQRMHEIIAADECIAREEMSLEEACAYFAARGYDDKVRLLAYRSEPTITVYSLRGVKDTFYGYLAPSTGRLGGFGLEPYGQGIILRVRQRQFPLPLNSHRDYPKLMRVFEQYGRWLGILGVEDLGALNAAVADGSIHRVILVSEALHEKQVADIAESIMGRQGAVRVVLIAGPSSSGKTTFARRLGIQLLASGLRPFALGLDDYFVPRERTPRDETGAYDYEALGAVDIALFNRQLSGLMTGEAVTLPRFDFGSGESRPGETVQLAPDTIILVEGIHGLNPDLVPALPPDCVYRIYVSALTQLNLDHHNRIATTDVRLLRRIVRDAQYRGYSAQQTIERWPSVRRGEEQNIFPYQENADVMFNSALAYELAVLKPLAEPLLLRVPHGTPESIEARRLLAFLRWVRPCPADRVPSNSLLREFIGSSVLEDLVVR